MRERDIQAKVVGYARGKSIMARKLDFGQGWPDYMFLHHGEVLFMEFKRPGQHPEPLQNYVHDMLKRNGFVVLVIDSAVEGMAEIDDFAGQPSKGVVSYSDITRDLIESKRK